MKTCFRSHYDTAIAFADPNRDPSSSGRTAGANRVWFRGDQIFSYGEHFCVARLEPETKTALLTTREHSISTSQHKAHVAGALHRAGWKVVPVDDPRKPLAAPKEAFVW